MKYNFSWGKKEREERERMREIKVGEMLWKAEEGDIGIKRKGRENNVETFLQNAFY